MRRNVYFSIFYDLLFRTSYRQKKAKNVIFWKYFFFRGSISRKPCVLRKIWSRPCWNNFLGAFRKSHQKRSTSNRKCFSRALVFYWKTPFSRVTWQKQNNRLSYFLQNFLDITIKIKPKLLEKLLEWYEHFSV